MSLTKTRKTNHEPNIQFNFVQVTFLGKSLETRNFFRRSNCRLDENKNHTNPRAIEKIVIGSLADTVIYYHFTSMMRTNAF